VGEALNPLRSAATYADLAKLKRSANQEIVADERSRVPVSELVIAEKVFQWRGENSDLHAEERHMRELMRTLELGHKLEPIVVVKLGEKLYVVDGHHRLAAYAALGKKTVPTREYLTEPEVERMMNAAKKNRWGHRDVTMLLVAYRHGLRVSELVDLRWEQIEFASGTLHVRRVKQGTPSTHPILGDELRALRRLKREQQPQSPFVFTSERGAPFGTAGFARMVERAGAEAKLAFKAHPHMLRHACGYALANRGHDTRALQAYLGHRNIQHTVRYTELSPTRFKDFWRL